MALSAPGDGNEGGGDPTVTTLLGSWGVPQDSSNITRVEYELYEDGSSLGVRGTAVDEQPNLRHMDQTRMRRSKRT